MLLERKAIRQMTQLNKRYLKLKRLFPHINQNQLRQKFNLQTRKLPNKTNNHQLMRVTLQFKINQLLMLKNKFNLRFKSLNKSNLQLKRITPCLRNRPLIPHHNNSKITNLNKSTPVNKNKSYPIMSHKINQLKRSPNPQFQGKSTRRVDPLTEVDNADKKVDVEMVAVNT